MDKQKFKTENLN